MVGASDTQSRLEAPHGDNDDLSSLCSRPSIQNSPDWPSVRLPSTSPSVRTVNESDGGKYRDDILSLANFSCEDTESSDRGSVFTSNISIPPSNSRPCTPSGGSHDGYRPTPSENAGASEGGITQSPPSIRVRVDKRPDHLVLSSRKSIIESTSKFEHDGLYDDISLFVDSFNTDLPRWSEQRSTQLQIEATYRQIDYLRTVFNAQTRTIVASKKNLEQLESYARQSGIDYEVQAISEKYKLEREQAMPDGWEGAKLGNVAQNDGDFESSCDDSEKALRRARTQVKELAKKRDNLNSQIESLKNELVEAKREVALVRRSVVEEKQSLEQRLDEERRAKERVRHQLNARMNELSKRKSKFVSI